MIVGTILAAGASTRMGRPKALLPLGGDTFLTRICRTLGDGGIDDVLVVVAPPDRKAVEANLAQAGLRVRVIDNTRRQEGQLTSVLAGLTVADRPGVEALLVHLVDVPLVGPETVRALSTAFLRTRAPIVRPEVGGRHGHPVIFGRQVFDALRAADPAEGAKAVLRAHAGAVLDVPVDDPGACQDIDTPEEYERLIGPWPGEAARPFD